MRALLDRCLAADLFFHSPTGALVVVVVPWAAAVVKLVKLLVQLDHCSFYPQHNPRVRLSPMNCQIWPDSDLSDYLVVLVFVDWPEPARRLLLHFAKRCFHHLIIIYTRSSAAAAVEEYPTPIKCLGPVPKHFQEKNINKKGLKKTRMIWKLRMKKGFE